MRLDVFDESGGNAWCNCSWHLFSVLNDCYQMAKARADAKNLEFEMRIDEKIPSVLLGDEVRLKQIINNFLSNAVKYTKEGHVCLRLGFENPEETQTVLEKSALEKRFPYLNIKSGMVYCMGDEDFYLEMIETYLEEDKRELLEKEYSLSDWKSYQIHMHSLKSTSLTIGADELSEHAKTLELAVKDGNDSFVKEHHEEIMQEYDKLLGQIQKEFHQNF